MRQFFLSCCLLLSAAGLFAQQEQEQKADPDKGKFKKQNIFLGANANIGFAGNSFAFSVNPEIGYSVANWLDAGMAFNIGFFSQNATDYSSARYRNFNIGGGPFLRLWPVNFLHVQVQPEINWVRSTQTIMANMVMTQSNVYKYNPTSLLVGIGYGTRSIENRYSYITLMIDVLQGVGSPYRDRNNDPLPVFRAGMGFYLNKGKK